MGKNQRGTRSFVSENHARPRVRTGKKNGKGGEGCSSETEKYHYYRIRREAERAARLL